MTGSAGLHGARSERMASRVIETSSGRDFSAAAVLAEKLMRRQQRNRSRSDGTATSGRLRTHRLFDHDAVAALARRLTDARGESDQRLSAILQDMLASSPFRKLAPSPDPSALATMRDRFPHCREALDLVESSASLARLGGDARLRLPRLLLLGPPGIGKTFFVHELASACAVPTRTVDMSAATTSFGLSGLDLGWSTGRPGAVFELLVRASVANPIIVLDEIDKVSTDTKHPPTAPLYSLLEEHSARSFVDEAVGVPIDASRVCWVATANSIETIDAPLLSRFTVVTLTAPTAAESRHLAASINAAILDAEAWGGRFPRELSDGVLDRLAGHSPREVRRMLFAAYGRAAREGRERLLATDVPSTPTSATRSIGFLAK